MRFRYLIPLLLLLLISVIGLFRYNANHNGFQKSPPDSDWSYQSTSTTDIVTSVKSTPDSGIVKFAYQDSSLQFELPLTAPKINQTDSQTLQFDSPNQSVKYEYRTLENGLKENIILLSPQSTNTFKSTIKTQNADVYLASDGTILFYRPNTKEYLYRLEKPYASDKNGNTTYRITYQLFQNGKPLTQPPEYGQVKIKFNQEPQLLTTGTEFQLVVTVDQDWLSHPSRQYPITIDPTVLTDPYDNTNYINTGASSNYSISNGQLSIGTTSCWANVGLNCNSSCNYASRSADTFNDYFFTYYNPTSCGSYLSNYILGSPGACSSSGTGNCYMGLNAGCKCDVQSNSCTPDTTMVQTFVCSWQTFFPTSATVQSTNLLIGVSNVNPLISFGYNVPSVPTGGAVSVIFSDDGSTWRNAARTVGATAVINGTGSIGFTGTPWTGSQFYYKLAIFSAGQTGTPIVDSVSLTYDEGPVMSGNCLLEKSPDNSSIRVRWDDFTPDENGYYVDKSVDGGAFGSRVTLGVGITATTDGSVSSGHTYQYRVAPYWTGPIYGKWCYTPTLNLQTGSFKFDGVRLDGLRLF